MDEKSKEEKTLDYVSFNAEVSALRKKIYEQWEKCIAQLDYEGAKKILETMPEYAEDPDDERIAAMQKMILN